MTEIQIDLTSLRRLVFIKYLFSVGLSQSYQPEPLFGVSILSFHDSIELFLQLAAEKFNIRKTDIAFNSYWKLLGEGLKAKLSQEESMRKLNKARVGLKHNGIIPSKTDIESFRATTTAFFDENCPVIFGVEFKDISMVDIISYEKTRVLLEEAKGCYRKGLIDDSLQKISLSFEYLISNYEKSKTSIFGSPFFFGESMTFLGSVHLGITREYGAIKKFVDEVASSIAAIQKAIRMLSFGIDYKKYIKFKSIIPSPQFTADGTPHFSYGDLMTLNDEDLEYCIDFIVESALKLQEFDFELRKNDSHDLRRTTKLFYRTGDKNI